MVLLNTITMGYSMADRFPSSDEYLHNDLQIETEHIHLVFLILVYGLTSNLNCWYINMIQHNVIHPLTDCTIHFLPLYFVVCL